jgi:hypothetical protein
VISPTYVRDQTLFAVGYGPAKTVPYSSVELDVARMALFLSTDAGATWSVSRDFGSSPGGRDLDVALSPFFEGDGVAILTYSTSSSSPASNRCGTGWTTNGGKSWELRAGTSQYQRCSGMGLGGVPGTLMLVVARAGLSSFFIARTAFFPTLEQFVPSVVAQGAPQPGPLSFALGPAGPSGRTVFVAGGSGVWAWGPGARDTGGTLPCAFEPIGGFGRVWRSRSDIRAQLGCPTEPERPVQVRVQSSTAPQGEAETQVWIEDESESWYALPGVSGAQDNRKSQHRKEESLGRAWVDMPEQVVVDGAVERFEGGLLIFTPLPDGTRAIYLLPTDVRWVWQLLPD